MRPRRQQATISFQSDRAKARLAVLTRGGRSQAEIMEEALDRMPEPESVDIDARRAEIEAILDRVDRSVAMTIEEFDALEYDRDGLPR